MEFATGYRRVLCFAGLLTLMLITSCSEDMPESPEISALDGATMGTSWRLQWVDDSSLVEPPSAHDIRLAVEAELARINGLMSTWDPDSELSVFNASLMVEPIALHENTLAVIDTALFVSRLTGGSYDITLQPVIALWGFSGNAKNSPDADQIARALEVSGYQQLVRVGKTVRKRKPGLAIDVSSLAKGYAVDQLGELVESLGVSRYLVDIGGEIRTRTDGQAWRVGVESPEGDVPQVLALRNAHIASSGSYRNYRIEDGKRLSHIIDGETGRPIEHDLVSVSVVHESAMLADAWATALLVVGEVRALKLIENQGLVAQLTFARDGEFHQIATDEFKSLLIDADK